jgi:hypothetical protein
MGHVACKLQQNTRSIACVAIPLKHDAPLLQLAIDTLPSLTLANAVEGTLLGGGGGNHAFSHAPVRRLWSQSKISALCNALRSIGRPEF